MVALALHETIPGHHLAVCITSLKNWLKTNDYENIYMQYTAIFSAVKMKNLRYKK